MSEQHDYKWVSRTYTVKEHWLVKVPKGLPDSEIMAKARSSLVGMESPTDEDSTGGHLTVKPADACDVGMFGTDAYEMTAE